MFSHIWVVKQGNYFSVIDWIISPIYALELNKLTRSLNISVKELKEKSLLLHVCVCVCVCTIQFEKVRQLFGTVNCIFILELLLLSIQKSHLYLNVCLVLLCCSTFLHILPLFERTKIQTPLNLLSTTLDNFEKYFSLPYFPMN